jgi:hypothetical protein
MHTDNTVMVGVHRSNTFSNGHIRQRRIWSIFLGIDGTTEQRHAPKEYKMFELLIFHRIKDYAYLEQPNTDILLVS